LGVGERAIRVLEVFMLYRENLEAVGNYGRNLFFTSKDYVGVGPMGPIGGEKAGRVGDEIAIIGGMQSLPILRSDGEEGMYRFVGPCHTPGTLGDEDSQVRKLEERVLGTR
jgi:hypothetical protein